MEFDLRFVEREALILLLAIAVFPITTLNLLGFDKLEFVFRYFIRF